MTREEAIEVIKQDIPCEYDTDLIEALEMAIKALEHHDEFMKRSYEQGKVDALSQEPTDAISRDAVMRLIENKPYDWSNLTERHNMLMEICKLPSVTQKSGTWHRKHDSIVNDWFWECDKCGCGYQHEYNYCPNCGAKMESED